MTYGDVAAAIGTRAARAVGQVMARYGADVTWWRVIRFDGRAPAGHESSALERYLAEDTPIRTTADGYRVRLPEAGFRPCPPHTP